MGRGHELEQGGLGPAGEPRRGVRRGAETGGDVQAHVGAPPRGPAGAGAVDAAVGDDRAVAGQAQLAAVGVAREHEVVAVGGERVEHPGLGGVGEPQAQVVRLVGRARDAVVVVAADVRVVDAADGDAEPVDGQRVPGVGGVEPAVLEERGAQVAPRQLRAEDPVLRVEQVVRRVLRPRPVVVVAAPHDEPGLVEQAPQRAQHLGHGARVGEVVAGVHHEVRLELREPLDEPPLEALAGTQVQVTDVQHAQRPAGGGDGVEDLEPGPPQREPVPLDPDRVAQPERAGGGHARGGAQGRRPRSSSRSSAASRRSGVRSPRQGWRAARRRRRRGHGPVRDLQRHDLVGQDRATRVLPDDRAGRARGCPPASA